MFVWVDEFVCHFISLRFISIYGNLCSLRERWRRKKEQEYFEEDIKTDVKKENEEYFERDDITKSRVLWRGIYRLKKKENLCDLCPHHFIAKRSLNILSMRKSNILVIFVIIKLLQKGFSRGIFSLSMRKSNMHQ